MNCAYCNKEFIPTRSTQRFCCKKCNDKSRSGVRLQKYTYTCVYCGKEYHPKQKDRNVYCSRECRYKHQKEQAKGTYKERTGYYIGQYSKLYCGYCAICGDLFQTRNGYAGCCSQKCQSLLYSISKHIQKTVRCKECGNTFKTKYGDKRKQYCSELCMRRALRRIRRTKERARLRGVRVEAVNPLYIFKRDKYKCRICGVKTPLKYKGTYHNNAPELDHIIPLSLGGEHSKRNTQCLCHQCNKNKSNRCVDGGEQLFLFG